MMIPYLFIVLISWIVVVETRPSGVSSPVSQSTACGDIVRRTNNSGGWHHGKHFEASEVFECLSTVPFHPEVASRFVKYFNDTIQFHSTLAYLRNPPKGYQQPAVDLVHELEVIQNKINQGYYRNEYQFEEAVQRLIYSAHDKHIRLNAGVLSAFRFVSPWSVVSLSPDGKKPPRVYLRSHVQASRNTLDLWQPSPIRSINGEDPEHFFVQFAQIHSPGNIDPHADWNSLMYSPALTAASETELFRGLVLYPGDSITIVLENGTRLGPEPFRALYVNPGPTGPLETGGDFYNFFVLGLYPAGFYQEVIKPILDSFHAQQSATVSTSGATSTQPDTDPTVASTPLDREWAHMNPAHPKPNLLQANVGNSNGPLISGYFLEGTDLAVLSIPSFKARGYAAKSFGSAISQFISKSSEEGKKRIVIDLQRNGGGSTTLAVDTFKRFFPEIDPVTNTRMRAHDMANELGRVTDKFWNKVGEFAEYNSAAWRFTISSSDWVASNRIDADTSNRFKSWPEFYGPTQLYGDSFTKTQRYNYSDILYVTDSLCVPESAYIVYGYEGNPADGKALFAAESITILTDGLCDSACALFVEMMRYEAGVKAVVAGGRPEAGPMQATGGTRGARGYSVSALDLDFNNVKSTFAFHLGENVSSLPERINNLFMFSGGVNMRDAIRKDEDVPLQFLYDAADCRIYYTQETLFNMTALWLYAGQAMQSPDSHCVANSTGHHRQNPPEPGHSPPMGSDSSSYLDAPLKDSVVVLGDDGVESVQKIALEQIVTGKECSLNGYCIDPYFMTTNAFRCVPTIRHGCGKNICVPRCYNGTYCRGYGVLSGQCRFDQRYKDAQMEPYKDGEGYAEGVWGYCEPDLNFCGLSVETHEPSDETNGKKRSISD